MGLNWKLAGPCGHFVVSDIFYPQSKSNHRTQFTTAQRDVKEAFRRGQGLADSPRSDRGHPWSRELLDTSHNKITSLFCAAEATATQIFPRHFLNQNRSNNLSILPDLDSNRISIHSPNISSDILCRFVGFITDFVSDIFTWWINFLALWRNVNFRSISNTDSQACFKNKRIL